MNKPDIPLYKLDLTASSPFNKINREEAKRENNRVDIDYMFIPLSAPFYTNSVKMYRADGTEMILNEDYDFYGIMSKLTAFTAKEVGLYIRILNPKISEWSCDYQTVGNFNKITQEILNMLKSIQDDDRLIDWNNIDNKPLWFVPELHQHDLPYQIFGFSDLAKEILRVGQSNEQSGTVLTFRLEQIKERLLAYIETYRSAITKLVESHNLNLHDAHSVRKDQIELGLVDNFKTATLEEVLEGTRKDLHMTPYTAAQAAVLAAGRNERLYPSGTLPILRYGNDSFIPPKIDGSFEGMGGIYQRPGACLETSGELLMLQRRYNGRVKGLYFLRCSRWDTNRPIWEFTGYRYQHPQATADGANISAILAGSNQYIMVIGDEDKGIWYWVETNGTFNPAQHVLNRITDATLLVCLKKHWKAQVCADDSYREFNLIAVALTSEEVKAVRPSFPSQGAGARDVDGWRLFGSLGMDGRYVPARINFQTNSPGVGNLLDGVFVPYYNIFNGSEITSCEFKPITPVLEVWRYHAPGAYIRKNGGGWAFSVQYRMWWRTPDGKSNSCDHIWRGNIGLTNDVVPTMNISNGPNEKIYTLDPLNIRSTPEGNLFGDYKVDWRWASYLYTSGTVAFNGYRLIVTSSNMQTIPLGISLDKDTQYLDGKELSGELPKSGEQRIYAINFGERNPIGLSAGFQNQFVGVYDTENWESGIVMARQVVTDAAEQAIKGTSKWMARTVSLLNNTWHGRWDNLQTTTLGGKPVEHYPLTNYGYDVNLGTAVLIATSAQGNTVPNRKQTWNSIFGVDAFSWLLGNPPRGATATQIGDGLLIDKSSCSLVGNVVTHKPEVVFNVSKTILRDIQPMVKALLHPFADISRSWSLIRTWGENNDPFYWLICSYLVPTADPFDTVWYTIAPVRVTGKGTKIIKDGYDYYDDATITFRKPFRAPELFMGNVLKGAIPFGMAYNSDAHSSVSMSWNNFPSTVPLVCAPRTLHRWGVIGNVHVVELLLDADFAADIKRIRRHAQQSTGPEYGWTVTTGAGYGAIGDLSSLTEGAGVISYGLRSITNPNENSYDLVSNSQLDTTKPFLGMSNLLISTYTIYFKEIKNVILGGKSYDMDATFVDLYDIDPNPANKKYYVYLKYNGAEPEYVVTQQVQPETPVCSMLAEVNCGITQINSVIPYNRYSMDGAIVSTKRQGSAILSTPGSLFEIGQCPWFKDADFLPE